MKSVLKVIRDITCVAILFVLTSLESDAVSGSLNGVYSRSGYPTQVLVFRGRPVSNFALNNSQEFFDNFKTQLEPILGAAYRLDYSYVETKGKASLITRMYDSSSGELSLTFTIDIEVEVLIDSGNEFRSRTTMSYNAEFGSSSLPPMGGVLSTFTEGYVFVSNSACEYSFDGVSVTLTRIIVGTGATQGSPLIPTLPNWTQTTTLNFPIVKPNGLIWCDPPYATSFQYDIAPGRPERIASLTLPKGFGSKIQVLATPSAGGAIKLVGSFNSGTKIDFLANPGFEGGVKSLLIRKIKPKVDLKKKAPYPVGLTFTSAPGSAVSLKIRAKK